LDEHALEAVHGTSFGIPRKIGAVVEQALTYALFDQKRTVTAEMVPNLSQDIDRFCP